MSDSNPCATDPLGQAAARERSSKIPDKLPADVSPTVDSAPSAATPSCDVTTEGRPPSSVVDGRTRPYLPGTATGPTDAEPEGAAAAVSVPGYEIESVLGRGGMGVVYKARHLALKRTVALKMVLAGGHVGPRELVRFRIEAEAAARLQHPNIVQVFEVGEAGRHPYCALEFVEGGSLAARLAGKPLPDRQAARLVEALARAVQLAHSRNVVHRDLKPANVLLTPDGTPKITDFGLARQLDSDSGETQAGQVMGTPSYMAPEQASGRAHEAGPAADTYALGAILYECLVGRPPFTGQTVMETLDQVRTQEPVPPARLQPGVPLDLETICLKCLRKEPEKRYASAAELADDLVRYQQGEPILARPVGKLEWAWRWCRRNPLPASLLAGMVLVFLTGFAGVVWQWREAEAAQKETSNALAVVESQKKDVEGSLAKAEAAEEAGRKLLYTTDMQLAPFLWRDDRTTAEQLRVLLAKHIPEERRKDEGGRMNKNGQEAGSSVIPPHSSFILHPWIYAGLSGTITSTCWNTALRFSRGMVLPSPAVLSPRMVNW